jgi:O-acetyl-ADP-ribose deacetylase (regulator of RNase III)
MRVLRVEVGDLVAATTEVVGVAVRGDGSPITPGGRRLELAAGPSVARHLAALGDLPPGSAVLTPGGELGVPYLLHLVVRTAEEPLTEGTVRRALDQGLARVADWGLRSLTLPPLGTGAGGLDAETAASLMAEALTEAGSGDFEVVVRVDSEYERDLFARVLS